MKRLLFGISCALISLALPQIASAQNLKEKVIDAWMLVEGSEVFADGKKVAPWAKGSLIISGSSISFFVLPKERPKTDSVRAPAGPMVAWYGTYTVEEAANTFTVKVVGASSPGFEGITRVQKVTFNDDTMTTTSSVVDTPEGPITPVNVWKKAN